MGLGVHENKRQLHGDIPGEGEGRHEEDHHKPTESQNAADQALLYSPASRHHQLHLDSVGHQDS